jgi:hypothetical protein
MTPEPQRFFFMHMQKTGGTALLTRLKRYFGDEAVYPDGTDGPRPSSVLTVEHLLERWSARRDRIRVVTGHFPLCTTDVLDAPFTTLTILRDPIERTLSYLRHRRMKTPAYRGAPLEKIYENPISYEGLVHNHMVKMLALRADEMSASAMTMVTFTEEHLARAKERSTSTGSVT